MVLNWKATTDGQLDITEKNEARKDAGCQTAPFQQRIYPTTNGNNPTTMTMDKQTSS